MPDKNKEQNLRLLSHLLFERAKNWWFLNQLCQIGIFGFGLITIFIDLMPNIAPLLVAIASVLAEIFIWQSNRVKEMAESLLRNLDFLDSFGWEISKSEISDLLIEVPRSIKKHLDKSDFNEVYFASKELVGAKKSVQNTQESAWWTKHLSSRANKIFMLISLIILSLSVLGLLISINTIQNVNLLASIGKVVVSFIMLVFSIGLIKTSLDYYELSTKAEKIERKTEELLKNSNIDNIQATKLLYEYQIARATAPLIPTFVYKTMQNELNDLWNKYRQS